MARASISIEDADDGTLTVGTDFGDKFDESSRAHGMVYELLRAVLQTAPNFRKIDDTMPEQDAEPSVIVKE